MTREVPTADVFAAAVPENVDPSDMTQRRKLIQMLSGLAYDYVYQQFRGRQDVPIAIRNMTSEWCITNRQEDIEKFQPAHHCADCLAGNDQARAFLRNNPSRWVALANLHYTEVWRV